MRLALIGPVAPFRSGIARHTTALARALADHSGTSLSTYSFKRQYPGWLYPGERDIDPRGEPPQGLQVDFCLDAVNPLSWRATAARVLEARPEMVVMPAWTFFLSPCLGWIARALRGQGVPVMMIVHNAEDHEAAGWKTLLSRYQLRGADRLLTHNAAIAADLANLVPGIPVGIHPHPLYDDYPAPRGVLPRRAALELLFFGIVRPYKGLDLALRALAAAGLEDVRLSVVGEFWQGRAETEALIERLGIRGQVDLVPHYVSDRDAAEYFARCDAVLAPYRSATGSGVVALAQWYACPVIASDVPGLSEAIEDGRTGWIFPAGDVSALAKLLEGRVTKASAASMRPAIGAMRAELSWTRFADAVLDPVIP